MKVPDEVLKGHAELELEIEELKRILETKEEQLRAFDLVIGTLKNSGKDFALSQRFRTMGLQEACIEVVKDATQPLHRNQVAETLLNRGYSTKSNKFGNVVGTTLLNLYKEGKIELIKKEGRVAYSKKVEGGSEDDSSEVAQEGSGSEENVQAASE